MINIKDTTYAVKALLPSGKRIDLSSLLADLSWEENAGELAQRAIITMANTKTKDGYVNNLLSLCVNVFIYANGAEVMRGIVWESDFQSGKKDMITITIYDKMIYLQNSEENSYFAAGGSTENIISTICKRWGIDLSYTWKSFTHPKVIYSGQSISEEIIQTLDEAARKLGKTYVASMDKDVLNVSTKGMNAAVYIFDAKTAISAQNKMTLDGLVTQVVVVGTEDDLGRTPIISTLQGKTEFGILQKIVSASSNDKIADAKAEAQKILDDKGKPDDQITVEAPDVPTIRKGHKIKVNAGNLTGYFYVKGVSHKASSRTMTLELERV